MRADHFVPRIRFLANRYVNYNIDDKGRRPEADALGTPELIAG